MLYKNEHLNSELLTAVARNQHQESEISLMKNSMHDRMTIYNSEISNLQATIQNQSKLQLQHSGFTEDEIRTYIIKKISLAEDEYKQESNSLKAIIQSENEVARVYLDRLEHVTQRAISDDPAAEELINALTERLKQEELDTTHYRERKKELDSEVNKLEGKYIREKHALERSEDNIARLRKQVDIMQKEKNESSSNEHENKERIKKWDELITFLENETDRLRDDIGTSNVPTANSYMRNYGETEHKLSITRQNEENNVFAELSEVEQRDFGESKSRNSPREADKVVVPPWPKSHDLDGWKSQLLANVLSACADPDQDTWIAWLGESFTINPALKACLIRAECVSRQLM